MEKISYYTEIGLQQLKDQLHILKTKERAKIAEQLAEARGQGDLSENAEYEAAKEAQELLEIKISQLEKSVVNARTLATANMDTSHVFILCKVKIKDKQQEKIFTYTIVAEEEADLKVGKISVDSPIGKGLLGKQVGETVVINTPSGKLAFEVLEIGV